MVFNDLHHFFKYLKIWCKSILAVLQKGIFLPLSKTFFCFHLSTICKKYAIIVAFLSYKLRKLMILRVFLLFLLCFFVGCDNKKEEDLNATRSSSLEQGERLNFSLIFNDGREFFIKADHQKLQFDNEQKATLFVFFTTWCKPCNALIPHLNTLQDKYKDSFTIVGVLLENKGKNELDEFVKLYKINYPIALGEGNYLLAKSIGGVSALPVMLLYSSDGKLINHYLGIIPQEMLDIDIQKAIM